MLINLQKKTNLKIIILSVLYLIIRLAKLNSYPVFVDEAIYVRWAQFIFSDWKKDLFISLADGKPPLFMWLVAPLLRYIKDPLLAGRLVSVFLGLLTLIFLIKTVKNFFDDKTAFWAGVFYLTSPFFFIFNRMALIEGLLSFTLCLQIYFISLYWKTKSKGFLLLSGFSWGLSMLAKTSAFFFFPLYLPLGIYLPKIKKFSLKNILSYLITNINIFVYLAWAGFLGALVFLINKLSIEFPSLLGRSQDFSFTFEEFFQSQYKSALQRLIMVLKWIGYYSSPVVFGLFILSIAWCFLIKKSDYKKITFFFWTFFLIFIIPMSFLGKILSSRYFLPLSLVVLILGSFAFDLIKSKRLKYIILTLVLVFNSYFIGLSLWDENKTPFTKDDKIFYLQEWSSGHGIKEAFEYLKKLSDTEKITVGVEGFFGTLPDGFMIYRDAVWAPNLEVIALGAYVKSIPGEILKKSKTERTFLLGNSHRFVFSEEEPLRLIKSYQRPAGGPQLLLYEVINED